MPAKKSDRSIAGEPTAAGLRSSHRKPRQIGRFVYGDFINARVAFLIIAAAVFFFVIKPVNALMARFAPAPAVAITTRPCPECVSDIPVAATRCTFCTSRVGPAAAGA